MINLLLLRCFFQQNKSIINTLIYNFLVFCKNKLILKLQPDFL